jgi:hypothetical protein
MIYTVTSQSGYAGWGLVGFMILMPINFFLFKNSSGSLEKMEMEFKNTSTRYNRLMDALIVVYTIASFLVLILRSGRIR